MLGSIRKFSGSIYAKVLLAIIIIPFVFWGMGDFTSGGKNVVLLIDKEKYSTQQFVDFINKTKTEKVNADDIEEFLADFIGQKLIEKEIENFGIKLSDTSLSKLIKHQKKFKRDNEFSRNEYEKFLLENNITAVTFESLLSQQEKKKQLFDLIGGGIYPSKFLINVSYDNVNQKRDVRLINLTDVFKKQINFSQNQILDYFNKNKDKYSIIYKTIKLLELTPEKISTSNEFSDLFFKKIDEIDDLTMEGKNLDFISKKFNLGEPQLLSINEKGQDLSLKNTNLVKNDLVKKVFSIQENEPTAFLENKNKYYLVELTKTENIQKNIEDENVKNIVLLDLSIKTKRKMLAEIVDKINKNNFDKNDFEKLSKKENVNIQTINLNNRNDDKTLKIQIVNEIYNYPEKKVFVVSDLSYTENYLIYVNKIKNVTIGNDTDEYKRYLNLSQVKIANELLNTYDYHLKNKYKVDINYKALDVLKNYFN